MSVTAERRAIEQSRAARAAAAEIESLLAENARDAEFKFVMSGRRGERTVTLSRSAADLLVQVLDALGNGREPSVMPFERDLSTSEVADLLGVSRQYVARLLDDGRLPFERVGNRRRVSLADTLAYLRADQGRRVDGLRALAEESVS